MLKVVASLHNQISESIQNVIFRSILPVSIGIILTASFISILLVSRIVQPVQQLTTGAEEIKKGNFDHELNIQSRNEIGQLATSFGQMSKALKASRQELYEYSQGLEKKVAERTQELTRANTRLTELDRLKSEFLSLASHQMRAPLTSIKGYASLILDGTYGKISEEVRESSERILESANSMVRAVEDFLNVSRIEQGEMKYDFAEGDLAELAQRITERMQPVAENKELALSFVRHAKEQPVRMDAYKMEQVFTNLIDNAIKYTATGTITVTTENAEGRARVCVQDSGVGLSQEAIGKLFQRYSRADGAARVNVTGTGLGLYVAKQLVEAHKGKIWAESEGEGKGTTFIVELPLS
jgi:signal transduction histidine kinase